MEELLIGYGELWYSLNFFLFLLFLFLPFFFLLYSLLLHCSSPSILLTLSCRSAQTTCAVLLKAGYKSTWLDARSVLFVEKGDSGAPFPEWSLSKSAIAKWQADLAEDVVAVVITGTQFSSFSFYAFIDVYRIYCIHSHWSCYYSQAKRK